MSDIQVRKFPGKGDLIIDHSLKAAMGEPVLCRVIKSHKSLGKFVVVAVAEQFSRGYPHSFYIRELNKRWSYPDAPDERAEGYCLDCQEWDSHLIDGVVCLACYKKGMPDAVKH